MSCITEILKIKGDKEFLPVGKRGEEPRIIIEGGGLYKGYEYLITFTCLGHRCGYVAVPPEHPVNGQVKTVVNTITGDEQLDYDSSGIDCHGGVTFLSRESGIKELLKIACTDLWIGFDCAHCYDGKDLDLVEKYYGSESQQLKFYREFPQYRRDLESFEKVRSFRYVEKECKKIINQLKEAA